MKEMTTPSEKGRVTLAIHELLKAKAEEKTAHLKVKECEKVLMEALAGDLKAEWETEEHKYALTATYGKTRSSLDAELIKQALGVEVTPACFKVSAPWDELRVRVIV